MKRTPWFSATRHSPTRVGEYEYRYGPFASTIWMWWDGQGWRSPEGGPCIVVWVGDQWRGLTEQAK